MSAAMNKRFDCLRDFLSRNEILFKTITATFLSLMAIIVSAAQLVTAWDQRALSQLQTRIVEAQALPQFEIALHQELNDATGKADDNYLVVSNNGGPVHEFAAESALFLRVSATMLDTDAPSRLGSTTTFDVPVNGYFTAQFVSAAGKGQLVRIRGYHNNTSYITLASATREAANGSKWFSANVDELIYVSLHYRDLLDRSHEDYYEVPTVGAGWRMADADGRAVFQRWKGSQKVELSSLNAEQLLTEATKRIENGTGNSPAQ